MLSRIMAGFSLCVFLGVTAVAQPYPGRPVRLVVPFAPGGSPDIVARIVAQQLSAQTGKTFFVDNRSGGDGIIGAQVVAESAPDGYTLLVTSSSFAINPSFHVSMPFDVNSSFEAVTNICAVDGFILAAGPAVPANTLAELITLAKTPNRISYGSPGIGNSQHLVAELFQQRTGVKLLHVPYNSSAPVLKGVMGGEVDVAFLLPHSSVAYIEAGKIRALGYTGAARAAFLPNVPTLAESGVTGMEVMGTWAGMFAPAKTPPAIVALLNGEVAKALAAPVVRDRLFELGYQPVGNSSASFKAYVAEQVTRIRALTATAGIGAK